MNLSCLKFERCVWTTFSSVEHHLTIVLSPLMRSKVKPFLWWSTLDTNILTPSEFFAYSSARYDPIWCFLQCWKHDRHLRTLERMLVLSVIELLFGSLVVVTCVSVWSWDVVCCVKKLWYPCCAKLFFVFSDWIIVLPVIYYLDMTGRSCFGYWLQSISQESHSWCPLKNQSYR